MTEKSKADQQVSPKVMPVDNTSTVAQRARLLVRLKLGPIDTLTARRELNILMPAARIKELKKLGHQIGRRFITLADDQGHIHRRIALYFLITLAE